MEIDLSEAITTVEQLREASSYSEYKFRQYEKGSKLDNGLKDISPELTTLNSCSQNNVSRTTYFTGLLSTEQRNVFLSLHKKLSDVNDGCRFGSRGASFVIDADPGTGKSFLMGVFATTFCAPVLYTVYNGRLVDKLVGVYNIIPQTNCQFIMHALKVDYFTAINMWFAKRRSLSEMVDSMDTFVKNTILPTGVRCIILDEYTVCSPWFVIYLNCLARARGLCVIFVGNFKQLNTIDGSAFVKCNNFYLAVNLTDELFRLQQLLRQSDDQNFASLLGQISSVYDTRPKFCEIKMNFKLLWMLFERLRDQFLLKPNYIENLYICAHHRQITNRLSKLRCSLREYHIPYVLESFKVKSDRGFVDLYDIESDIENCTDSYKFYRALVLTVGLKYLYFESKDDQRIVTLVSVTSESVTVQDVETDNKIEIYRKKCSVVNTHPEHLVQLQHDCKERFKSEEKTTIYQYPLKNLATTYHAVQGLTFSKTINIELNCDTPTFNSIYVGLTRIQQLKQIGRLESQQLISLLVTEFYADENLYELQLKSIPKSTVNNLLAWMESESKHKHRLDLLRGMDKIPKLHYPKSKPNGELDFSEMITSLKNIQRALYRKDPIYLRNHGSSDG